jgi:plasmid maintenance system antidote protein VapI
MPQVQFLEEQPSPGSQIGQSFGSGLSQGLSSALSQHFQQKQNKQQLSGLTPAFEKLGIPKEGINELINSGLSPELAANLAIQFGRQQQQAQAQQTKQQQDLQKLESEKQVKLEPFRSGLDYINRQRQLLKTGHLGKKFGVGGGLSEKPKVLSTMTKSGRKARAEYERLGKALISLSSNIPIRNKQEFQTLAESLYDPNISEAEIEGNLDAMERIIRNNLGEDFSSKDSESQPNAEGKNQSLEEILG